MGCILHPGQKAVHPGQGCVLRPGQKEVHPGHGQRIAYVSVNTHIKLNIVYLHIYLYQVLSNLRVWVMNCQKRFFLGDELSETGVTATGTLLSQQLISSLA